MNKKINSIYHFSTLYTENDNECAATVVLEINYNTKQFSIKPYCGTINDGFKFEQSSHKYKMWKALLISIDEAIDFANKELGIIPNLR